MSRSQQSFNKKEREKKKQKKKQDKEKKKEERKANASSSSLDDMIAYVDEYGNITSEPPDPTKKEESKAEDIQVSVPKQEAKDPNKKGVVTFYNDSKGYGFIREFESKNQVFVHANNANFPIKETDKVIFKIEKGPRGLIAVEVRLDK